MKKILFCLAIFFATFFYSQKIGLYQSYKPEVKHAQFKWSKLSSVEDLNYSIKPFIDSLITVNNIDTTPIQNFDAAILEDFRPQYGNGKIEKYLKGICEKNGYDAIVIIKSYGNDKNKYSLLATDISHEMDCGVVTFESAKKNLYYYNNIIFLYYSKKEDRLLYPVRKRSENLFYNIDPIKNADPVLDNSTKKLNNKDVVLKNYLTDFKNRIKLNFSKMMDEIKK